MPFKIHSELSENQIESDVSSYLGYITPLLSKRYRLISVDEQLTGADKLYNRFFPIYLQFKVSQGLDPDATMLTWLQHRPLGNIISYRKKNNLSGNPILYFELRKKAKTAKDLQHNILLSLNDPPQQYALYVAPLTLSISDYEEKLNGDWFLKFYPHRFFSRKELNIHDSSEKKNIVLKLNPFLRHHVAITPHKRVLTHEHHYSFSKNGGNVAWHSGEQLGEDFRLSNQLSKIFSSITKDEVVGMTLDQYLIFIRDFQKISPADSIDNPVETIQQFSKFLKIEYNIKVLLVIEHIDSFNENNFL